MRELIESGMYQNHLIVDNAMAYYAPAWNNIPTAYCPRKFVGIPDGGIAYIDNGIDLDCLYDALDYSWRYETPHNQYNRLDGKITGKESKTS